MWKQGDECNKEFATGVKTDWIGCLFLQIMGAIIEGLDKLEHGARFDRSERLGSRDRGGPTI